MSSETHPSAKHITIEADRQRCVGAGTCWQVAPSLFDQDEEMGLVNVVNPTPTFADLSLALEAEGACPSGAIAVSRD